MIAYGRVRLARRNWRSVWAGVLAVLGFVMLLGAVPATAQIIPGSAPANSTAPAAVDPYGRDTPRGLADGLIAAIAAGDYERAGVFFDLSRVPAARRAAAGADYARRLQSALDAGGSLVPFIALSDDPAGRVNDSLPLDEERVGTLAADGEAEAAPLLAKASQVDGLRVWRIAAQTMAALPRAGATEAAEQDSLRGALPPVLTQTEVAGAPLSDWLILLVMALGYYVLARLLFAGVLAIAGRRYTEREASRVWRVIHAASAPLSLYLAVLLFLFSTRSLHVAIVARQLVSRFAGAVAFIALAWFVWRLVDVVADIAAIRMDKGQRRRAKSVLAFARRAVKLLLIAFALIAALGAIGIDVSTGIAALGLGGLALALGAQKTVENIVGSVSVIADEPIRVGDFCRIGDVVGTVEDIRIRSTRIRTNERTRVTIPNGVLAAMQIENYALRDRYLFSPKLPIVRDIDADGLERVIEAVRTALADADFLWEGPRVTLIGFTDTAWLVEVFCWIDVLDFDESLYLQEKLYLSIMRHVEAAGGRFAVPLTSVRVEPAPQPSSQPR